MVSHVGQKKVSTPVAVHQLHAVLQKFAGSLLGAQQVLRGEIITNPADRRALASMIHALLQPDTQEILRTKFSFQKIAVQASGKKGWSDSWY
jgi:hypothetical protein